MAGLPFINAIRPDKTFLLRMISSITTTKNLVYMIVSLHSCFTSIPQIIKENEN